MTTIIGLKYMGEADYPTIGEISSKVQGDEVSAKVLASALNHRDLWILKNMYADLTPNTIMGADGLVEYEGERCLIYPAINWGRNQRVFDADFKVLGMPPNGTFANSIVVKKTNLFICPEHLSIEEGAALPLAGLTAYRALFSRGGCSPGESVLITGIGGGVAMTALVMAVAIGCKVYVTSSDPSKIEKAIKYGAAGGVDYKNPTWEKEILSLSGGIDRVVDGAGGDGISKILKICNHGASINIYGGTAGKINNLSPQLVFWKQVSINGTTMGSPLDFENMLGLVADFQIRPIVDSVYAFNDYQKAFDRLRSGDQMGKIVLLHQ